MSDQELSRWRFWRSELSAAGLVSGIDATLLLSLCRAEILASAAAGALRSGVFVVDRHGQVRTHPASRVLCEAHATIRQILAELNLTPARRGVKPNVSDEKVDRFAAMFPMRNDDE